MTRKLTPSTAYFPTSNMADDLEQATREAREQAREQEIQEWFDAAVDVAKQAGQVII